MEEIQINQEKYINKNKRYIDFEYNKTIIDKIKACFFKNNDEVIHFQQPRQQKKREEILVNNV